MTTAKTFLSAVPDDGSKHRSHGYPDECYALTTFADSLVALAGAGSWVLQPPIVDILGAIVVDFVSQTQRHAEASLQHGWNGPWELPMGAVATVYGRRETNEQNARIERHLLLLGTGMTMGDFHRRVVERLLDVHSCDIGHCPVCAGRFSRGLAEIFQIVADGTAQRTVHLFSNWQPDDELVRTLGADGIELRRHDLRSIPAADLEANGSYSIWDGTPAQADDFLRTFWGPPWKAAAR